MLLQILDSDEEIPRHRILSLYLLLSFQLFVPHLDGNCEIFVLLLLLFVCPRAPLYYVCIFSNPSLINGLPLQSPRLPNSMIVSNDNLPRLALYSEIHAMPPCTRHLAQCSTGMVSLPMDALTKLDTQALRPLTLQPLVCSLAIVTHLEPIQQMGRILHQPRYHGVLHWQLNFPPLFQSQFHYSYLTLY